MKTQPLVTWPVVVTTIMLAAWIVLIRILFAKVEGGDQAGISGRGAKPVPTNWLAHPRWPSLMQFLGARLFSFTLIALLMMLLLPAPLSGQTATGSIVGTVTDTAGRVISGANVSLVNTQTNEPRIAVTDDRGYYSLTLLPPADYNLSVEKPGFKKFLQQNIKLNVGDALTVNTALQVGDVSQQVTVTSQPSPLQAETSSLGQVIDTKTILDLPVNGRNSYSFAVLVPGVLASAGFSQTAYDEYSDQFVSINGSRPNQNVFLLDGGMNSQPALNGPGYYPSIDLVQENKVQTNNYSAEFSNSSGGVVNVITKSGTNGFHGSMYEFFRDTGLNANNYFANLAGLPRAPFQYNQFGGTVGGPILKNKTFFFFNYEGLRWTQAVTTTGTVPTDAQRAGDFSETLNAAGQVIPIYNPFTTVPDPMNPGQYTRTQFPGNKIPAGMIDTVANNTLAYIPHGNQPGSPVTGANNFISNASSPINKDEYSLRIDQALPKDSKLFGRYSIATTHQIRPPVFGTDPKFQVSSPILGPDTLRQMQATIDYTTVLKPTLVLELNSSFVRFHLTRHPPGLGFNPTELGFPSYFNELAQTTVPCFPTMIVGGLGTSESIGNVGWGGLLGQLCWIGILNDANQVFHQAGNLTKAMGTQTLHMGGDFGAGEFTTSRFDNGAGFYVFGPDWTQGPNPFAAGSSGVGTASFLLGTGDSGFTYTGGPDEINHFAYGGGYLQDDWKATHRLTMNLGFRYDYNTPWRERFNRITGWNPTAPSPLQVPGLNLVGGLEFPGTNGLSRYHFNPDKRTGWQPRLGFAYAARDTTVLRGGYGLFMGPAVGTGYNGNGVPISGYQGSTPWVTTLDGVTPLNLLSNPFPTGFTYATGNTLGLATDLGQAVVAMDRHRRVSYAEQWNLDIQQMFPKHVLFDLAYAGSHGVHLYADYNANQLPDSDLALGGQLNEQVANPFYGKLTTGGLSGPTVARSQLLLPYPQFTGVTLGDGSFYGASVYNALQLKVERRFDNGVGFLASYTWSKLMDNATPNNGFPGGSFAGGGIQDWDNLRREWSLATFDTPQYFVMNGMLDLPFGRGKRFAHNSHAANYLIGGWQLNGIFTMLSGTPQQVFMAANTLYNYGGTQRANWNGRDPIPSTSINKRLNQYFDVNDFSNPGAFTYGNSPRTLGALRSPGLTNMDLSALKNTHLSERWVVQFRAEAFNLFNHPQFGPPDTALGDGTTGVISNQVNAPRELQFAVKILF
jgi:hypothetical protein